MDKRASGILMHISSLPSKYDIGDFGPTAYNFADFLYDSKQSYWQILPLNPTNKENGDSPYFSESTFAGNPLLISPELLEEEGLLTKDDLTALEVKDLGSVDFDSVRDHKLPLLEKAFKHFLKTEERSAFDHYLKENSYWLDDYALFRAIKKKIKKQPWSKWQKGYRDRDPGVLADFEKKNEKVILKEKFLQYIFYRQWVKLKTYCNQKGITIIGDLPIYVSYDSSDVWVNPGIFKLDEKKEPYVVSGVPPDYFSATGQLWNNPVYRWDMLQETGYKWWIDRLSCMFKLYDLVRIDHFRGLVQFWEVPSSETTAVNGSWQDVPTYDFFDKLISHFQGFPVIAEDLGIITDDVKEAKTHYGFPGMKILMFAFGEDNPLNPYQPHNFERNCIVYTGTHDNNTLQGWVKDEAREEDVQRLYDYIGDKSTGSELNWKLIRLAMMSIADGVIIPVQDILGLGQKARMNQPSNAFGNWAWRMKPGQLKKIHSKKMKELTMIYARG